GLARGNGRALERGQGGGVRRERLGHRAAARGPGRARQVCGAARPGTACAGFSEHSPRRTYLGAKLRRTWRRGGRGNMRVARYLAVAAGCLAGSAQALAGPPPWAKARHNRGYDGYDYAPVVRVEPLVQRVRVETPRRECWDDVRYVESKPHISDPQVAGRTLLGGLIGGVVGHQFGSGRGRDAATVVGAMVGAGV